MRAKRRAAERAHPSIRERAAQELSPQIGRIGRRRSGVGCPAAPLSERVQNFARAAMLLAAEPAGWMETLGARITEAEPGRVVLELEAGPQHRHGGGVVQGGVITQIADAAMGMSLATLQPDGTWNTTIELKINFIRPVVKGRIRAVGRVIEMGETLLFSEADVVDEAGRLVARASSTCLPVPEGQGRE